jgi:thymidylate synthase ThyX
MTVSVKMIADSTSPDGIRLTTLQLRYPRFIHAEFMTHRVFSRNASSSRAVPVAKLIEDIKRDTAMPMHWGKNQKGMQADEECNELIPLNFIGPSIPTREHAWGVARDQAIIMAQSFDKAGYHKQIVNRLLEPFSHINVVVTSTDWANFFHLRDHKDAMPEIQVLARLIKEEMSKSPSMALKPGEWHLPYITEEEYKDWIYHKADLEYQNKILIKCSVARCARVSYLTYEGKQPEIQTDLALYDRLVGSDPLHASPAEHQATPDKCCWYKPELWTYSHQHGNFRGWRQYRKMLPNECVSD